MIFMRTGGQSNGKGGWAGTSWVWKSCCGTVNRKIDTMWDSPSVWHRDWQQRMEIPSQWCKKPQWVWDMLVLDVIWERVTHCTADWSVWKRCTDMITNPVHYITSINDSPFSLCLCAGVSSESLAADPAILREQFESSWRFSWGKWVRFSQFLWMLCCPLNISSRVKTLVHTSFDLLSPDSQRASFCRSSSPRNCWDATEAT